MVPPSWSYSSSYQITILLCATNHFANRNQTILFVQPRFGYIYINGGKTKDGCTIKDVKGILVLLKTFVI